MKHPHLGAKKRVNSRRDVHELWRSSHQMSFASRLSFIIDLPLIELGDAQLPESIASLSHPHRCAFVFGSPIWTIREDRKTWVYGKSTKESSTNQCDFTTQLKHQIGFDSMLMSHETMMLRTDNDTIQNGVRCTNISASPREMMQPVTTCPLI